MKKAISTILLFYFRTLAKIQLWKIRPTIIGVTGSSGKTSVMETIGMVLQNQAKVKLSHKANSQSGLPLNILGLEIKNFTVGEWVKLAILAPLKLLTNWHKYDYYVAEMGIDSAKWPANMDYLLTFLQPKIGVFTSVTSVHAQAFDHLAQSKNPKLHLQEVLAAIANEKGKLIQSLPPDGFAVLNEDDALVKKQSERTTATVLTFGTNKAATVQLAATNWTAQGTEFVLKDNQASQKSNTKQVRIKLSGYLLPTHYGLTLAAAGAVGLTQSIHLTTSLQQIQTHFSLPPSRASLLPGINNSTILDSSYNSSPLALHDFLDMLLTLKKTLDSRHADTISRHPKPVSGSSTSVNTPTSISYPTTNQPTSKPKLSFTRLIALLGDMRELGHATQSAHEQTALKATQVFDQVFLVGPAMTQFATPIFHKHHLPTQAFSSPWQVIPTLQATLQPGDLLFVKGSQNTILLETAIEPLLANPADVDKLCRRDQFWINQRKKLKSLN